jgi:hypothetical protein
MILRQCRAKLPAPNIWLSGLRFSRADIDGVRSIESDIAPLLALYRVILTLS